MLQNGQQVMNPVVGLGLTQTEVQALHRLQGMGFLIDHNEQKRVGHARQLPLCAGPPLAGLTSKGAIRWRRCVVGGLECGQ